jgi:hypothetical protein
MSGSITDEAPVQPWLAGTNEPCSAMDASYTDSQLVTLRAVQASLRAHQIEAEIPEIVHALLEALATRPALCRGLVAAYLLGA